MAFKHLFFVFFAALYVFIAPAAAAQDGLQAQGRPVPPQGCKTVIANFFGSEICLSMVEPEDRHEQAMIEEYANNGINGDEAMRQQSLRRLKNLLWTRALDKRFGKKAYEPTDEEIEVYHKAFRESVDQQYEDNIKTKELLEQLLAENEYAAQDQTDLEDILEGLEKSISFYEQRRDHFATMPPEFQSLTDDAEKSVARAMTQVWKVNKLLFDAYGGRLVYQQEGMEPVDAYSAFLHYIRKEGKLVLTHRDFKDVFDEMETYLKTEHDFIPESETDIYGNYFASPDWPLIYQGKTGGYEALAKKLKAIPVASETEQEAETAPSP